MGLPAGNTRDESSCMLDICVVGAGPHGLAFLTHLLSQPEHLDHFDEHPRNATLYSHSHNPRRVRCKLRDPGALRSKRSNHELYQHFTSRSASRKTSLSLHQGLKVMEIEGGVRVCVMDRCGEAFLRKWDTHFEVLDIPFLRSTTHQHPDPLDLGLLSAFAHHTKRYHELVPLKLTGSAEDVDRRRQGEFRGPYLRPTTALFRDFIQRLVKGFHLDGAVNQAEILKLEPVVDGSRISGFRVTCRRDENSERVVHAKRVVLALGHANLVSIPDWAVQNESSAPKSGLLHYEDLITAMAARTGDIQQHFHELLGLRSAPSTPLKGMRVLIVGGGQTSVQLAQLAVSKLGSDPRDITFLTRSAIRSQPFDVSLQWVSTTRYESLAGFWSADHQTRAHMLQEAKGACRGGSSGASVDAECVNWLRSSGIHVKEHCEVLSATWDLEWKVELWDDLNFHDEALACDLIWLATGNTMDFLHEPVVDSLRSALEPLGIEIQTQGKLPVLGEDLSLKFTGDGAVRCEEGVAVHVMGAYAALELGPGALNLMGARAGACRISRAVRRS